MHKTLFVSSEVYPLIKTGGLADVSGSLPQALQNLQQDVRILLPAYQSVMAQITGASIIAYIDLPWGQARLLESHLPDSTTPIWLVDFPEFFDRPGGPYQGPDGEAWGDNPSRFALLSHVAVKIALGYAGIDWQPDIVHGNDWPCGLIAALLSVYPQRPATVFTIHNLAYQGLFPFAAFHSLDLPIDLWSPEALEFHDQLSFMKGGLVFSDRINTVSPSYAQEIQTPQFGCGLEGLLTHRSAHLSGIVNGVNEAEWDPGHDEYLIKPYTVRSPGRKKDNKAHLQASLGLSTQASLPMLGFIGRLVQQKGIDLILDVLPELIQLPLQLVFLGSGEAEYEARLIYWARRYPQQIALTIGYDEVLAHRIEASADLFLMPSRFEPCGLNQMYSQRYGTIPLVRKVGGLKDTVVDATTETLNNRTATGIAFKDASPGALLEAIKRALLLYGDVSTRWKQMQLTGMRQDFSWTRSAHDYLALYDTVLEDRRR